MGGGIDKVFDFVVGDCVGLVIGFESYVWCDFGGIIVVDYVDGWFVLVIV